MAKKDGRDSDDFTKLLGAGAALIAGAFIKRAADRMFDRESLRKSARKAAKNSRFKHTGAKSSGAKPRAGKQHPFPDPDLPLPLRAQHLRSIRDKISRLRRQRDQIEDKAISLHDLRWVQPAEPSTSLPGKTFGDRVYHAPPCEVDLAIERKGGSMGSSSTTLRDRNSGATLVLNSDPYSAAYSYFFEHEKKTVKGEYYHGNIEFAGRWRILHLGSGRSTKQFAGFSIPHSDIAAAMLFAWKATKASDTDLPHLVSFAKARDADNDLQSFFIGLSGLRPFAIAHEALRANDPTLDSLYDRAQEKQRKDRR